MADNDARYDLVVLGATGFVGNILCRYLVEHVGTQGEVKWAVAGRSPAKLDKLVNDLGPSAAALARIPADVTDAASLRHLCAQTRVVVTTVGPYALRGEPLVKMCAETGTDYCDLSGEIQWIRRMIRTYEAQAQASGARIVPCCGFDSVPSDLGVYYLQQQARARFGQPCDRVKMRLKGAQGGVSGGTAASGLNLVEEAVTNPSIREELKDPYSLCPDRDQTPPHPPTMMPVQYDEDFQEWVTPFIMAEVNTRIVLRSNALQEYAYGPAFQYDEGILTGDDGPGWVIAQAVKVGLDGFTLAAAFEPTRWVLQNWVIPAAGEGPSAAEQDQGFYDLRFCGHTPENRTLRVKVTGDRDPGYGSTARILAQAGLCLALDIPKSAKPGGFWTPATIFGETLIDRLIAHAGLTFTVL